jgi:eukaryotic-like serine/threonine-protein kinase
VTSHAALPQPGEVIGDKYRIEGVLGRGGMGAVFEATHRVTGKRFAIKWMLPNLSGHEDAVKRFIREAQVAGRFQHPNVVEVYDIGQQGDASFYMVMELLEGESLEARVEREGRMPLDAACRMLLPCMRGVARAHAAGIVHRDLKPANIFVCRATLETPERPKVLDFGISKTSGAGDLDASLTTKAGAIMGTPHYMSPEQVRGQVVDHRVDIYAFGVILYQLVSGQRPFDATSYIDLVLLIATETPKSLAELVPGTPQAFAEVVRRAMARDPAERFATLDQLAAALEPYALGQHPVVEGASASVSPLSAARVSPIPLDTPLSTESGPSLPIRTLHTKRARALTVLAVLAGIVVLGWLALAWLPSAPRATRPNERARGAGADSIAPARPSNAVRAAASSVPAPTSRPRAGELVPPLADTPHPAPAEQPAQDGWVAPRAATAHEEPQAEPTTPRAQAAPKDEKPAERTRRSPRRQRGSQAEIAPKPTVPKPTEPAPRKPAGRLGVSLDEAEF